MTEKTDAERFAWLFEKNSWIQFYHYSAQGVEITSDYGPHTQVVAGRRIRSKAKAIDAWRKCVDELMKKQEKGGA